MKKGLFNGRRAAQGGTANFNGLKLKESEKRLFPIPGWKNAMDGFFQRPDSPMTTNPESIPHYDAEQALRIAGGNPKIRDHIAAGILDLFSKQDELAALLDVALYRRDPTRSRALTHRAISLARQGAMPALESICEEINAAINAGKFRVAEEFGGKLPAALAAIRAAVISARADVQHPAPDQPG